MRAVKNEMRARGSSGKWMTTKASSRNRARTPVHAANNKEHPVITSVSAALDLIIMKGARAFWESLEVGTHRLWSSRERSAQIIRRVRDGDADEAHSKREHPPVYTYKTLRLCGWVGDRAVQPSGNFRSSQRYSHLFLKVWIDLHGA